MITRAFSTGLLLCVSIVSGCAHSRDTPPFSLRGQNTQLRIDFSLSPGTSKTQPARTLAADELCYVPVGDATVECFRFGSLLVLAPDDGELLVADNPIDDLHPVGPDASEARAFRSLGAVGVIAASIERLPATLAEYLQSDGENLVVARSACRQLLRSEATELTGFGHGGRFLIAVRLTPEGRRLLSDALRPASGSPGALLALSPSQAVVTRGRRATAAQMRSEMPRSAK